MKNIAAIAAFAAVLVSSAAFAAPTAELKVTGVIKPPACLPTFSGGGVVDYGTIPASSLAAGQYKALDKKQVSFQVSCDAAVKVGFTLADNRASSRVAGIVAGVSANSHERFNFGLGTVAGKNVGGYALAMDMSASTADGRSVENIYRSFSQNAWVRGAGGLDSMHIFSFAQSGSADPLAARQFNVTINVQAVLNKPENLPLTQDVPLDGSATIEVQYL